MASERGAEPDAGIIDVEMKTRVQCRLPTHPVLREA